MMISKQCLGGNQLGGSGLGTEHEGEKEGAVWSARRVQGGWCLEGTCRYSGGRKGWTMYVGPGGILLKRPLGEMIGN